MDWNDTFNRNYVRRICSIVVIMILIGCTQGDRVGVYLETAGKILDDYGSVSVSSPLFADRKLVENGQFAFDLQRTAQQYYDEARKDIHGAVASMYEHINETDIGFRGTVNLQDLLTNRMLYDGYQADLDAYKRKTALLDSASMLGLLIPILDPSLALNEAAKAEAAATTQPANLSPEEERINRLRALVTAMTVSSTGLSGPTTRPAPPEFQHNPPSFDESVLPNADKVRALLSEEKFHKFQALLKLSRPTGEVVIPNSSAINNAAGTKTFQNVFNFLGKPELASQFKDKIVLVGVSMVSVTPGTQTEKGYMADVSVSVSYDYQPVRFDLLAKLAARGKSPLDSLGESDDLNYVNATLSTYARLNRDETLVNLQNQLSNPSPSSQGLDWPEEKKKELETQIHEHLVKKAAEAANVAKDRRKIDTTRTYYAGYEAGSYRPGLMELTPAGELVSSVQVSSAPLVAAVTPMTDMQTLDLSSSIRDQQALALKIALVVSGFGAEAQAAGLIQDIQQFQQDVATRSTLNTVAGYSNSGGVFGYQIGPSLFGVRNTGVFNNRRSAGAEKVLQRQSFPVLVFVGIDRNDLRIRLSYDPNSNPKWQIVEPRLQFRQTTRWIPIKKTDDPALFDARPRLTEKDRLHAANHLRLAANIIERENPSENDSWNGPYPSRSNNLQGSQNSMTSADLAFEDYVRNRIAILRSHVVEAFHFQAVPIDAFLPKEASKPSPSPVVEAITPSEVFFKVENGKGTLSETHIAITGRHLDQIESVAKKPIGGTSLTVNIKLKTEHAILVALSGNTGNQNTHSVQFQFNYKDAQKQDAFILTPLLQLKPFPNQEPRSQTAASEDVITLRRTFSTTTQPAVSDIVTIPKSVDPSITNTFIQNSGHHPTQDPCGNFEVRVKSGQ
ncbi:MAG: hypothetical protein KF841_07990 [Phycisphaerae bacterium]|nr:hypothetical protein [Phycisphaerae bacterium]